MKLHVQPAASLRGSLTVPGDKSISHRALLLGALAQGTSHVRNWLRAADCQATLKALRSLGIQVETMGDNEFVVHGQGLLGFSPPAKSQPIDCQGSGTTMRLLAGILAGQPFESVLDGHAGLRRRPMERIAVPLRQMGARIDTREGKPPITIRGGSLHGIDYAMPVASAQVKSAILLAALYARGETVIHQPGPARDHTERMLAAQGVQLTVSGDTIRLTPTGDVALTPLDITVPSDFSSAAFPLVAALLAPEASVRLVQIGTNPTRTGLLDVLIQMGANVQLSNQVEVGGEPVADLLVQASQLQPATIAGDTVVRMIDEFPILAVAATQARGRTIVRDARELRMKESDRIAAVANELRLMGARVDEQPDGFVIHGPTPLVGAEVDSHGDHRLAMALVVAGMIAKGQTIVQGTEVIADSFPGFVELMQSLGARIE